MRTRLFSLILALFAVLLPSAAWAQEAAYVVLSVNESDKTFENYADADITYTLTFKYDANRPTDAETGEYLIVNAENTVKYFDLNTCVTTDYYTNPNNLNSAINAMHKKLPGWLGWNETSEVMNIDGTNIRFPIWDLISYDYSPKITNAEITDAFAQHVRPTTCFFWFAGCRQLTSIKGLEKLDTSESESLEGMFANCRSIENLDLSNFNTSKVQTLRWSFLNMTKLRALNVKGFDTSKVTKINSVFSRLKSLEYLDLSSWVISGIKDFTQVFENLSSLSTLDISNFDMTGVTTIRYMFKDCTNLSTIYVGEKWKELNISGSRILSGDNTWYSFYQSVFGGCNNLVGGNGTTYQDLQTAINAEDLSYNGDDGKPTSYGRSNAIAWLNFARPDGGPSAPGLLTSTKAFAVVYDDGTGNKTLYLCNRGASEVKTTSFKPAVAEGEAEVEYTSGLTVIDNLSTMGDNKWNLHALLTEAGVDVAEIDRVVIEPTFAYMRPTTCESWFSGMSNATFEGLENLNTTECTSMKDMFRGTSISSLDFSTADLKLTFKTSKVTDMSGMFADMTNLTSVTFASNFSTANVTNMENMFSGCSSLTDISTLAEYFNTVKVTDMSGMFQGCSSLTGNTTEDSGAPVLDLSTFYTGGVTDMADMFNGCSAVKLLNISSFNTSAVTSMAGMFKNCSQLKTITVDLSFTADAVTDNGTDMFLGDVNLVGGDMTVYDAGEVDKDYAHIDEAGDPGYLTEIAPVECTLWGDTEHDNGGVLAGYAGKTGIVNVRRTFVAGQWTTLCLPFDMTAKQITTVFGEGTAIKALSAATRSGEKVSTATFADAATIEAGKPYLIMPAKVPTFSYKGQTVDGFRLSHKTFVGQPANMSRNGFAARGTFSPLTLAVSADTYTLKANQTTASPSLSTLATVAQETALGGLQAYFVDMKVSDYTLTIPEDGVSTLYLPFAAEIPNADFFIAATVKDVDYDAQTGACTATLKQLKQGVIPAYTGVFIQANPGTYKMCVTDTETGEEIVNKLHGVLEDTPVAELEYEEGAKNGYASKQERIEDCDDEDYALYFVKKGLTENFGFKYTTASYYSKGWKNDLTLMAPANKAYLKLDYNTNAVLANVICLTYGDAQMDEATGINSVNLGAEKAKTNGVYYNLNGQRVAAPAKGIYIKDGKKVLVK